MTVSVPFSAKWLLVLAICVITFSSPKLARAQGNLYFVNTTSDTVVSGACANGLPGCSLRGAIQAANAHVGADGIKLTEEPLRPDRIPDRITTT